MQLPFPRMHIAESVINRILNAADGIPANPQPSATVPPIMPQTAVQGARIDAALSQPVPELPPINETPDPGGALTGRPVLDQLVNPEG